MGAMGVSSPATRCYRPYPLSYGFSLRKKPRRKPGGFHRGHPHSAHSVPRR